MKTQTFFAAALVALGTSMAIADTISSVEVQGGREQQKQFITKDQRAIQSCATFFVADILPGNQTNVKVIDAQPTRRILDTPQAYRARPVMRVAMQATDAGDGKLLAKAACTVDSRAAVINIRTTKLDEQRLASITSKGLRFVASVR